MLIPEESYQALVEAGVTVSAQVHGDRRVDLLVSIPTPEAATQMLALEVKRYTQPVTPREVATAAQRWRDSSRSAEHAPPPDDTPPSDDTPPPDDTPPSDDTPPPAQADPRWPEGQVRTGLLLVTPTATAEVFQKAADLGVSVIALNSRAGTGPRGHLALGPGNVMPLGRPVSDSSPQRRKSGLPARGESQIVKTLLLLGPRTQTEIARWAYVSQPRVSQVLKNLVREGLVQASTTTNPTATNGSGREPPRRTWAVVDWERLLSYWMDHYPGPGGVTTYWYGLDAPVQQAHTALAVLRAGNRRGGDVPEVLVSGDVAADVIAPWARPVRATVYAEVGADLSDAGLTPSSAADATLALIVPEDTGMWPVARRWWARVRSDAAPGGLPLADPLQVLYDVRHSPSVDAGQMAETLMKRIVAWRDIAAAPAETAAHTKRAPAETVQARLGDAGD